jgi:hypothetical protein
VWPVRPEEIRMRTARERASRAFAIDSNSDCRI